MCDEMTEAENAAWLRNNGLNRRDFATMSAGMAALSLMPGCTTATEVTGPATLSRTVTLDTPDGKAVSYPGNPNEPADEAEDIYIALYRVSKTSY